jgi:hypothetical protein
MFVAVWRMTIPSGEDFCVPIVLRLCNRSIAVLTPTATVRNIGRLVSQSLDARREVFKCGDANDSNSMAEKRQRLALKLHEPN